MVGVPGKSKGCLTCRKRKVPCDLRRPACDQCRRTKFICGGYARPIIFLNKSSQDFDLRSRGTSDVAHVVTGRSQEIGQTPVSPQSGTQKHRGYFSVSIPIPLDSTSLLHNTVLANFVNSTLPEGPTREPPLSWITTILDSANCHETLSLAGSAIGHGWTGHVEAQHDRVTQGRRCYAQAMSHLRRDLANKAVPRCTTTLAIACALVLYELTEFGTYDSRGWLAHTSGIETIIFQASAPTFVAGSSHKVFLFCRVVIILRSLLHRRTTFLVEDGWRHTPWTLHPKDSFHQLLDLVAEAPAFLETNDTQDASCMTGSFNDTTIRRRHLLVEIALLVSRLKRWHMKSAISLPQEPFSPTDNENCSWTSQSPIKRSANRHWYPARQDSTIGVSFEVLQQARLMLFYWAVVLTLQIEVFRNHSLRAEFYRVHGTLDTADGSHDVEKDLRACISIDLAIECADNIVKWFEFAAQDVWNSFGPAFGVFSLGAAITWYSIYRELPRSRSSWQADRSTKCQHAQNMFLRLVNHGSPPAYHI